ncbi:Similar to ZNF382: Zinc finger protein 382 (Homo sapiens) [Cotesia congregata]|uniref:Similar to ZNF382: Zinc finger protein 382 (Homo sapiens) n=1 Tax=Cotesia congregata TaxID=51543 RepID=A0A8J2HFH8_COTCN|nr:Similar to ZNF382: Zinc finger protein 382 (Homo sapiens) [Cotesia congregata]
MLVLSYGDGYLPASQSSSDNEEIYPQNLLGVAYKTSVNNSKEVRDDDGKYVCTKCGKSYIASTSLKRHQRLECGVDPAQKCHICNRRFRHKFVLTAHINNCERKLLGIEVIEIIKKNPNNSKSS